MHLTQSDTQSCPNILLFGQNNYDFPRLKTS